MINIKLKGIDKYKIKKSKHKTKRCTKCKIIKCVELFSKDKNKSGGRHCHCKECKNKQLRDYTRTKIGVVASIYRNQIELSNYRDHNAPTYNKQKLTDWLFAQNLFHELYYRWKKSGYHRDSKPSVDRINDYKGYSMGNIQLMSFKENREKSCRDIKNGINNKINKEIIQKDLENNVINVFYSLSEACRVTKLQVSNVSKCCNNIKGFDTAGGFKWQYKN